MPITQTLWGPHSNWLRLTLPLHCSCCRNDELQVAAYLAQLRQQQQHGPLSSAEAAAEAAAGAAVAGGVVVPAGVVPQRAANSSDSGCVASTAFGVMHGI